MAVGTDDACVSISIRVTDRQLFQPRIHCPKKGSEHKFGLIVCSKGRPTSLSTVVGRVDKTVSLEQLKFGMFLFGVGVGIGEIREVFSGDGMRKGWMQFVEGNDSSINILDVEFR